MISRYPTLTSPSLTGPPLTNLASEELVVLYPTFGYRVDDGAAWRILVNGVVYSLRGLSLRHRLMIRMLGRVMRATPQALASPLFHDRIRPFTASTGRGRKMAIAIDGQVFALQNKSKRNGHFSGTVRMPASVVERLRGAGVCQDNWLPFRLLTGPGDSREIVGRAHLIEDQGWSVISDIDDTMKHSEVTSKRALLANTFLREFSSIEGMASLYSDWATQGAVFHYVSSSPWQLYGALSELCEASGFPAGTFHLRNFRLRDHMLRRLLRLRRSGKSLAIESILRAYPQRRFMLVGDSGERDSEIYAHVARQFPDQVRMICIRELVQRPMTETRVIKAFRYLPSSTVTRVFQHPRQLSPRLENPVDVPG